MEIITSYPVGMILLVCAVFCFGVWLIIRQLRYREFRKFRYRMRLRYRLQTQPIAIGKHREVNKLTDEQIWGLIYSHSEFEAFVPKIKSEEWTTVTIMMHNQMTVFDPQFIPGYELARMNGHQLFITTEKSLSDQDFLVKFRVRLMPKMSLNREIAYACSAKSWGYAFCFLQASTVNQEALWYFADAVSHADSYPCKTGWHRIYYTPNGQGSYEYVRYNDLKFHFASEKREFEKNYHYLATVWMSESRIV